jgi:hypothetical protein
MIDTISELKLLRSHQFSCRPSLALKTDSIPPAHVSVLILLEYSPLLRPKHAGHRTNRLLCDLGRWTTSTLNRRPGHMFR